MFAPCRLSELQRWLPLTKSRCLSSSVSPLETFAVVFRSVVVHSVVIVEVVFLFIVIMAREANDDDDNNDNHDDNDDDDGDDSSSTLFLLACQYKGHGLPFRAECPEVRAAA